MTEGGICPGGPKFSEISPRRFVGCVCSATIGAVFVAIWEMSIRAGIHGMASTFELCSKTGPYRYFVDRFVRDLWIFTGICHWCWK